MEKTCVTINSIRSVYGGLPVGETTLPRSSFHRFVKQGIYSHDWGCSGEFNIQSGE
ncbi:MAG: hypothetical protein ABL903_18625 [Methylococcales bacterium]